MTVVPSLGDFQDKKAYVVATEAVQSTFNVYFFEQVAIGNVDSIVRLLEGGIPCDLFDDSKIMDSTLHW